MSSRQRVRGFTLVEMVVAMAVMGIVMTLAALEFKYVVEQHLFAESHLTAEQQARVAMAKVTGASRQASVVDSTPVPGITSQPAFLEPASTPGPRLVFTQAAPLSPDMPTQNGVPVPCYDKVQLYVLQPSLAEPGDLWEQADPYDPSKPCQTDYSHMPLLVARNVQAFQVQPIAGADQFSTGYRIDITIFDAEDHRIDSRAGALYRLSSVVTPLVFGQAQ